MRRLVVITLIALIAVIGFAPASGFAQAPASPQTVAPAQAAAAAPTKIDDTTRVLAIGLGAATGMVLFSAISTNMISGVALASLGQGIVVFTGTLVGGLMGNWLYARENH